MSRFAHLTSFLFGLRTTLDNGREWRLVEPMTVREWLGWYFEPSAGRVDLAEEDRLNSEQRREVDETGPPDGIFALGDATLKRRYGAA